MEDTVNLNALADLLSDRARTGLVHAEQPCHDIDARQSRVLQPSEHLLGDVALKVGECWESRDQ